MDDFFGNDTLVEPLIDENDVQVGVKSLNWKNVRQLFKKLGNSLESHSQKIKEIIQKTLKARSEAL